ncbi:nucleoside/nucleotide kinase family protein [Leucobacter sp. Psy1]|uniref:nucleoside/nucleotide kinase family protein n=1 Tax=Leucobacter sp. Psy1 TaxID=2875729 RepID=UPI001CD21DA4|nr:nucleoside/nucleotide kinase family protein [Leucobacter sp. Psy1]
MLPAGEMSIDDLTERARRLASTGRRYLLGIAGAPGSGKSTLAEQLVAVLGPELAVLVPMDGFHLASEVLAKLGRQERKGAHDTFDAAGYASLLWRIRGQRNAGESASGPDPLIYAPRFDRGLEESVGSAIAVAERVPLVVTEGNYLLLEENPWSRARAALDEVWFLAPPEERRIRQLVARHERFGRSSEEAWERSLGSDQRNAELITASAGAADLIVRLSE